MITTEQKIMKIWTEKNIWCSFLPQLSGTISHGYQYGKIDHSYLTLWLTQNEATVSLMFKR